jgi:hypothetical protein
MSINQNLCKTCKFPFTPPLLGPDIFLSILFLVIYVPSSDLKAIFHNHTKELVK